MFNRLVCSFILLAVTVYALSSRKDKKGPFTDDEWLAGIKKSDPTKSDDEAKAYLLKNKAKMTEIEEQYPANTVDKILEQVDAEKTNEQMRKELKENDPSVELPESMEELRRRLVAERRKFQAHLANKDRKEAWAPDVEISPRWQKYREASKERLTSLGKRRAEPMDAKRQRLEQRDKDMFETQKLRQMRVQAEEKVQNVIKDIAEGKRDKTVTINKDVSPERLEKIKKEAEERVKQTLGKRANNDVREK